MGVEGKLGPNGVPIPTFAARKKLLTNIQGGKVYALSVDSAGRGKK